jgi:hypothetical protein
MLMAFSGALHHYIHLDMELHKASQSQCSAASEGGSWVFAEEFA